MNKTITLLILGVIFLALLLMVLNASKLQDRQDLPASLPEKTRVFVEGSVPALAPAAPEVRSGAALAPPVPQVAPQPEERAAFEPEPVVVKTVPAQIDAGQAPAFSPQAVAPSLPAPPAAQAIPVPNLGQRGAKNITNIVVYATQEGATLRLGADAPLTCTPMLLRNPDRLALDCSGQWHVNVPGVPQNKFIKALRAGRQNGATRLVLDLHQAPASYRLVQTSPRGLDLRLR